MFDRQFLVGRNRGQNNFKTYSETILFSFKMLPFNSCYYKLYLWHKNKCLKSENVNILQLHTQMYYSITFKKLTIFLFIIDSKI